MTSRLWMGAAAGALLTAFSLGSAALAAEDSAAVNENGARGAPSQPVAVASLAPPTRQKLSLQLVSAPAALSAEPKAEAVPPPAPVAAPAPVPAPAATHAPAPVEPQPSEEAAVMGRATPASAVVADAAPAAAATPGAAAPTQLAEADLAADPEARVVKASMTRPAPEEPMRQHVAFPRRSAEAASAFTRYMHATSKIDPAFKNGAAVGAGLKTASSYDPGQLEEGMIAFGAMAALQSPDFVYGVMDAAADARSRSALAQQLLANPAMAARLPGAEDAALLADQAILSEAQPMLSAGRALKQAAYDVQHQAWSGAKAEDQTGRLAHAKAASTQRAGAQDADMTELLTRVSDVQAAGQAGGSPFTPVSTRSVALAALAVLDGTEGADEGGLETVLHEPTSSQCLKMAKLNLFQCLSVAGPEYEDVYCLGQHAVMDTGQCVADSARPLSPMLQASLPRRGGGGSVMVPMPRMSRAPGLK